MASKTYSRITLGVAAVGALVVGLVLFRVWRGADWTPPPTAAEFRAVRADESSLRDILGNQRSLHSLAGERATVLAFLGVECPLANLYVPQLVALEKDYRDRGVHFVAVYPHENEPLTRCAAHALEREIPFTVVKDFDQKLADSLGVTRTPTICVLDSSGGLHYRGRINDQYGVNFRREKPQREDLRVTLDELLAGAPISQAAHEADGCLLDRARPKSVEPTPTYADVAPVFARRCATCHCEGQTAPFVLAEYDDAVQWSKMIREVVVQRRMPPWHTDPRYGSFLNDRSLSDEEIKTIVAWIDSGMPRGDATGEPAAPASATTEWGIGAPDAVFTVAEPIQVPAEGVLDYDYLPIPATTTAPVFDRGVWIVAAELRPSNPAVVHHMSLALVPPDATTEINDFPTLPMLAAWAPGDPKFIYPPGTGLRVPQGSSLLFQVHHVPNGQPAESGASVAFKFTETPPEREVLLATHDHLALKIPPGDPDYRAETISTFAVDARIIGLYPHMHFRGKAMSIEALYPDGASEMLLSVPRFDFNWQTLHWLSEPKLMPAGTKIRCLSHYDNSRYNLNNPDPNVEVVTGPQSTDEMMVGWIFFVPDKPGDPGAAAGDLLVDDRTGQAASLADELRGQLSENADDQDARFRLAHALMAQDRWDEARAELEELVRRDPKAAHAHHALGQVARNSGRHEEAVEHFRTAIALLPEHAQWHNDLGVALAQWGRYEEALAGYQAGLKIAPASAILNNNLAYTLLKLGRLDESIRAARKALESEPDFAAAHTNLGLALAEQRRYDEAMDEFRAALRADPKSADAQRALGASLLAKNRYDEAVQAFDAALAIDPDSALAYSGRGLALAHQGQLEPAMRDFEAALARDSTLADAQHYYGQCLEAQKRFADAVAAYRRAVELRPGWAAPANNLAWLLATAPDDALRDGAEAVRQAKASAASASGEDPGMLDTLAAAYAENGQFDDAVRTMQRVIELAQGRVDAATLEGMRMRLTMYRAHRPYRSGSSP